MIDAHHKWNKSVKPLVVGLLCSVFLTLITYFLATEHILNGSAILFVVLGLAVLQAIVQCVLFLHVGIESKPHWSSITFIFTVIVLVIIVGGSLWIMYNLDYNMMPAMAR